MSFIGRERELADLTGQLDTVRAGRRADPGVAVMIRGRRRIGKSRLVDELTRRSGVPFAYFQAARNAPVGDELSSFAWSVATSTLPNAAVAAGNTPQSLTAALTLLDAALDDQPAIVVIDELPWLLEQIGGGAGELQRVWDTRLSKKPVLLLLLGSDLAMMEQLMAPDQPFYGRATEMNLGALTPTDIGHMVGAVDAMAAFDAYLVTGGLPLVAQEWEHGESLTSFLERSFASSTSALVVSGGRALDAEFPEASISRRVLTAIGGKGERTFTGIQNDGANDAMNASTLTATLRALTDKRIVAADEPLSAKQAAKNRRYRIDDPALRFWLAFVDPALGEVDRARPDLALARVELSFTSWRGRAIEPVVRASLERLLPDERWPQVQKVGGWWPRNNTPEIDLVGATRHHEVQFAGTITWRSSPLTARDVTDLSVDATSIPGVGVGTALVAVCPGGADPSARDDLAQVWSARDLLAAWP
ncbi:ATP-binding protein [Cellulomonas sp.]|uniref:ATP-binding protein n=1 Tax=Cellulomonas sp. TaxID=40001 RepID=UPI003BAB2A1D